MGPPPAPLPYLDLASKAPVLAQWVFSENTIVIQKIPSIRLSPYLNQATHAAGAYPGFYSMKQLGISLLPPGWDVSPLQGYPYHFIRLHLLTIYKNPFACILWGRERGSGKVQCFAHKHNTMTWSVCELRPPNIESSTLTIWSPHLPQCLALIILKCSKYVFKTLGSRWIQENSAQLTSNNATWDLASKTSVDSSSLFWKKNIKKK